MKFQTDVSLRKHAEQYVKDLGKALKDKKHRVAIDFEAGTFTVDGEVVGMRFYNEDMIIHCKFDTISRTPGSKDTMNTWRARDASLQSRANAVNGHHLSMPKSLEIVHRILKQRRRKSEPPIS